MQLDTTRFRSISISDEQIVTFPEGIPGFEQTRRFVFLPHPHRGEGESPFRWMQCVDDGALAFPVISPWQICPDYAPTVPGALLRELKIADIPKQAKIYVIVTIPSACPERATVNLLAPVLINRDTQTARQVVLLNDNYSLRTPMRPAEESRAPHEVAAMPVRANGMSRSEAISMR